MSRAAAVGCSALAGQLMWWGCVQKQPFFLQSACHTGMQVSPFAVINPFLQQRQIGLVTQ